jgi:SAV_6107-like HEPN
MSAASLRTSVAARRSVSTAPLPTRSAALELLSAARRGLVEASSTTVPTERYAAAHLSALRCAAAVLAARARPEDRAVRSRPRSAWTLLPSVAPELAEWAAFFAAGAGKRAAAEAGLSRSVHSREADDLLRDAQTFLALVETTLGLPHQETLPAAPGLDRGDADPQTHPPARPRMRLLRGARSR